MGKTNQPVHGSRHTRESECAENFLSRGPREKGPDKEQEEFSQPHLPHPSRFEGVEGGPGHFDESMSSRTI